MSTVLAALRDGAFGRKVLNFAISAYALTTIYATLFTPRRIHNGQAQPEVKAHQHIVNFVDWLGLSRPAGWIQTHLVEPALDAPDVTSTVGMALVAISIVFHILRGPSIHEVPAQPTYGVVLGATILVDLHNDGLFVTAFLTAGATYIALLIFQKGDWNPNRFALPLIEAVIAPVVAIVSAPLRICAYIAVAPTERPMRVRVVSSELDPIHTKAAK